MLRSTLLCRLVSCYLVLGCLTPAASAQNVLVIGAESTFSWVEDVAAKIQTSGEVDGTVQAMSGSNMPAPDLETLSEYDAVLVWSDSGYQNATELGNALADYVDAGGTVVELTFSFHTSNGLRPAGRWGEGYSVFVPANQTSGNRLTLGEIVEPGHPLFDGVESFDGGSSSYHHSITALTENAQLLARWSNGTIFAAINEQGFEGVVFGLNFFPPSSDSRDDFWDASSDGAQLLINAIRYNGSSGHRHVCLKAGVDATCWGLNNLGQLGIGNIELVGDDALDMGESLATVDLGTSFQVAKVETAGGTSCALSTGGKLKCWGANESGQLGQGDVAARGDQGGELGNALLPIDLGEGFVVADFAMAKTHVCAFSTTGGLKCWGGNRRGQLGLGDTDNRGDGEGEMGDALPFVDLAGELVRLIALGDEHSCVVTVTNKLQCFGLGKDGRLGNGAILNVGSEQGQMGAALESVDLGTIMRIRALTAGSDFTCALFEDLTIKCFGANGSGQLGLGDVLARGQTSELMGAELPFVNLGTLQKAMALECSARTCCALQVQGTMKCWGDNRKGQLGLGDTENRGDAASEMGENLPSFSLSPLGTVREVKVQDDFVCARDDGGWKCWGNNRDGALGYGDLMSRGHNQDTLPGLIEYLSL